MSIFFFEASDSLGDEAVVDVIGAQVNRAATETATHYTGAGHDARIAPSLRGQIASKSPEHIICV